MKPQKRSSKCETVNLGVSFNLLDPHQAALYQFAKKKFVNFSAAAKRWLEDDMKGFVSGQCPMPVPSSDFQVQEQTIPDSVDVDFEPRSAFF